MKFGTGSLYIMPLISCGLCESRYSGSHVLLKGLNEKVSCIFCSVRPIWIKFATEGVRKIVLNYCDLVEISFVKALSPCMNCYPYFPHLLTDFVEIRYTVMHTLLLRFVRLVKAQGGPYFCCGH